MSTPYRVVLANAMAMVVVGAGGCAPRLIRPSDARIAVMGRVDHADGSHWRVGYPGVTFRLAVNGPSLRMRAGCTTGNCRLAVIVDHGQPRIVRLSKGDSEIMLAEGLAAGVVHTVEVVHRTEAWQGVVSLRGFVAPHGQLVAAPAWPQRRLLFIGDSVTCGEAIDRGPASDCASQGEPAAGANGYLSYGMLLARALGAQAHLVCYGGRGLIRDWRGRRDVPNARQIFDLAVADDRPRAFWDHAGYTPDVVVVSLGTNDFNLALGPFPARDEFVAAYVAFARVIRARYPAAAIILTEGAIVSDQQGDSAEPARPQKTVLRSFLDETARRLADPRLQVFPSTHYAGDACNAHPTRDQHAAMARDLEPVIRRTTGW